MVPWWNLSGSSAMPLSVGEMKIHSIWPVKRPDLEKALKVKVGQKDQPLEFLSHS